MKRNSQQQQQQVRAREQLAAEDAAREAGAAQQQQQQQVVAASGLRRAWGSRARRAWVVLHCYHGCRVQSVFVPWVIAQSRRLWVYVPRSNGCC
jgi:hypothetical protein